MKKVNSIDEAKEHFSDSIDPVTGVRDGKEEHLNSMDDASKFFAETTGTPVENSEDNNGPGPDGGQQVPPEPEVEIPPVPEETGA